MEHEKNGYILDPEDPTELARLITLDRAITTSMGGPLAGIPDTLILQNVLDLACGPGGWVLDLAFERKEAEVAGVDISRGMVDYAYARARTQQLPNASFGVMDITEPLDFADGAFDLVNARFLVGVLQGEGQWSALLKECWRLLRPGGVVRLVESDGLTVSTSKSLAQLQKYLLRAMHVRGYGFSCDDGATLGITPVLSHLLQHAGFVSPVLTPWVFDFSWGSDHWSEGFHLCRVTYELAAQHRLFDDLLPPEEARVEDLIATMLIELQRASFGGLTYGTMISGIKQGA